MSEKIGKASLRDAAIGTGIAVDKMLALTGQTPVLQIANIVMPTEEEREARRATDRRLDDTARRIRELPPANPRQFPTGIRRICYAGALCFGAQLVLLRAKTTSEDSNCRYENH